MVNAKFKTKISLKDTLREMQVKDSLTVKKQYAKTATVRSTATDLKKEGYKFFVSDRGHVNHIIVTRLE